MRIVRGERGQPIVLELSCPPSAISVSRRRERIFVQDSTNIPGWMIRERVGSKERQGYGIVVEKFPHLMECPRVLIVSTHRREPHLPIKMRLIWRNLNRHFLHVDQ